MILIRVIERNESANYTASGQSFGGTVSAFAVEEEGQAAFVGVPYYTTVRKGAKVDTAQQGERQVKRNCQKVCHL